MSMRSRVDAEKKKEAAAKADWDRTTVTSRREMAVEDKVAAKIASEMLKDNQKLRGVHSNVSIKKIIENEAKR